MGWTASAWAGSSWSGLTDLPFPWSTNITKSVNVKVKVLADGSRGKTQPATDEWVTLQLTFGNMTSADYDTWYGYAKAQTILKLIDLNLNEYIGTFIKFDKEEKSVDGEIRYWADAIFEQSPDPA